MDEDTGCTEEEWQEIQAHLAKMQAEAEEMDALIAEELWWRSPEGQAQRIIEEAQMDAHMEELLREIDRRIKYLTCRYELKTMSEKEFAERMLKIILTIRDAEKVRDEVSDDYVQGYEQGLTDLATFLIEEFNLDA